MIDTSRIDNLTGDAPVYMQYPRQSGPQPGQIWMDEAGSVGACYNASIGGGMTMDEWLVRTLTWTISPLLSADEIRALVSEIRADLEIVHAGHSVEWDGSNMRGRLTDEARDASERISRACEACEIADNIITDIEWLSDMRHVRAGMSDADLAALATAWIEQARENGYRVLVDHRTLLDEMREHRDGLNTEE